MNAKFLLLVIVVGLLLALPAVALAQDGATGGNSPALPGVWSAALALAMAANRVVAFAKPKLREMIADETLYRAILQGLAVGAGIVLALVNQMNLLAEYTTVPSFVGILVTGAAIGFGSEFLHFIFDLMQKLQPSEPTGNG